MGDLPTRVVSFPKRILNQRILNQSDRQLKTIENMKKAEFYFKSLILNEILKQVISYDSYDTFPFFSSYQKWTWSS